MRTIEFNGVQIEYDETVLKSYSNTKRLARAKEDPANVFDVFEKLYLGKDEEIAEALGGTEEVMGQLFKAVTADASKADNQIKN